MSNHPRRYYGKRIKKLIYMHRNPVMRRLVQAPEQWPWSSYRSYAYGEESAVRINQWDATAMKTRTPLHESPPAVSKLVHIIAQTDRYPNVGTVECDPG